MKEARRDSKLDRLRDASATPGERAEYALKLLRSERDPEVLLAAVRALGEREDASLRPALLEKYEYCDANGARRDQGGAIRAAILHALRPVALPEDAPLFERAATTYEFLYGESTGDLRAAALLALNEADHRLAGYHAVRLLSDPYTSEMSGEPAVTAARVLESQDQLLPLYAYAAGDGPRNPEVVAEALRGLSSLPPSLLPALVERYGESEDEMELLGLFDLLLAHPAREEYTGFVLRFLRTTTSYNIYRYLVSTLLTRHADTMRGPLLEIAREERDRRRAEILREALALR